MVLFLDKARRATRIAPVHNIQYLIKPVASCPSMVVYRKVGPASFDGLSMLPRGRRFLFLGRQLAPSFNIVAEPREKLQELGITVLAHEIVHEFVEGAWLSDQSAPCCCEIVVITYWQCVVLHDLLKSQLFGNT